MQEGPKIAKLYRSDLADPFLLLPSPNQPERVCLPLWT